MPAWLLSIISSLALPVLKQVLVAVLTGLEAKYPGLAPLVTQIINFIEGGGSATDVQDHCEAGIPGFCQDVKHD